jgi:hypothetical protein
LDPDSGVRTSIADNACVIRTAWITFHLPPRTGMDT